MWYFTWILGLGFALPFGIPHAPGNAFTMSEAGENDLQIDR